MINGELNEMLPCTPAGVLAILDHYNIDVKGLKKT
jgi:5,10-methylene-tetrahydrofolate dehydrogenase/methenyl tetrahydrofolate cyclohydrolase